MSHLWHINQHVMPIDWPYDMVLNDKLAESSFALVKSYKSLSEICVF